MGLNIPIDLDAWTKWSRRRSGARTVVATLRPHREPVLMVHRNGTDHPTVLFALESTNPTSVASLLAPLEHLRGTPAAVIAPGDISGQLGAGWTVDNVTDPSHVPAELRALRTVLASGHYLPIGAACFAWSKEVDALFVVVQHGLMTPFAPPLPSGAHLLAFTERDADFWRSGRTDVTAEAIGSELLWNAAHRDPVTLATDRPVFLGQLHGAELPRRISGGTAERFCREFDADYRPHPAEIDRLSRWQHSRWQRRGIRFAPPGGLLDDPRPVVSIFSTGVLEAAAAGIPSWVTCVRTPAWVQEFWERYDLRLWGGDPTPAPAQPAVEPAKAIAERALADGGN